MKRIKRRSRTPVPIAVLVIPTREDLDQIEGGLKGGIYICPSCDCVCQCNCI